MPVQYPKKNFQKLAKGNSFSRLVGTGRAYAELKTVKSRTVPGKEFLGACKKKFLSPVNGYWEGFYGTKNGGA